MKKNQISSLMRRNIATLGWGCMFVLLAAAGILGFQVAQGVTFQWSSVPWEGMLFAVLALTCLGTVCREKWFFRKEREVFLSLRLKREKGAIFLEVFSRLLMAGAFFLLLYLLNGRHMDSYQIVFFLPISILAAVIASQLTISSAAHRVFIWLARIMLVAYSYCNLIIHSYTRLTATALSAVLPVTSQVMSWVWILGVVLVIYQLRVNVRRGIVTCLIAGLLICTDQPGVAPLMLEFAGMIMLSDLLGKPATTAKVLLGAMLAYAVAVPLGLVFGWTENISMSFYYGEPRWAWGMNHTNLTALVIMTILLLIWYVFLQKHPLWTLAIFESAAAGILYSTNCRTVTVVLALFPLLVLFLTWVLKKNRTGWFALLVFLPVLFAAMSVIFLFQVPNITGGELDGNFMARFSIPYQAVREYGLHLFQTNVPFSYTIDNAFLHVLVFWGILPAAVIPILLTAAGWRFYKRRQYSELVLLALLMVYSLMENAVLRMPFGFALMLAAPHEAGTWSPSLLRSDEEMLEKEREEAQRSVSSLKHRQMGPMSYRQGLAMACAGYLLLASVMYWVVRKDWSETVVSNDPVNQDLLLPETDAGHELKQTFRIQADRLDRLVLRFDEEQQYQEDEREFTLMLMEDDRVLAEKRVPLATLPSDGRLIWTLEGMEEAVNGKQLLLLVRGEGGIRFWSGTTRSAGKYDIETATEEILTIGEEPAPGELVLEWTGVQYMPYSRWFWPLAAGLGLVLLGISLFAHYHRVTGNLTAINRAADLIRQYYYLLKTLVVRDFKVRYKASVLGVIWSFLNPLMMTVVYLFVFSTLFRSSILHFPVYLLSGIVLFNYFSEATNLGMQSIVGNAGLITKVYMPKYIFPISKALSSAINLVISLIPLLLMMMVTGVPLQRSLLLMPLLIIYLVIFCVGVSLILSTCMVYFRDIQFLWGILLTILNFFSPIFYPESIIPAQFIQLYHLNPLYQYLFFMRTIVIGGISPNPVTYLYCTLASFGTLAVGLYIFRRNQSSFVLHL